MVRHHSTCHYVQPYRYASPNIPIAAIQRFARDIARRFRPEKIVLFGSYAYGQPHQESDVDLLIIMPSSDVAAQEVRIGLALGRPFSHDILVRTPKQVERALKQNNWFLREAVEKGKVLYDAGSGSVGQIRRRRSAGSKSAGHSKPAPTKSGLFSLSAVGRKVSKGTDSTTRTRGPKNARS
jgi:predicted nucleotidyltransferase